MKPSTIRQLAVILLLSPLVAAADNHRFMTVKGVAEAEVAPDFVLITAVIQATDTRTERAKEDVDDRARQALEAIERFQIEDEDLAFSGVGIDPRYEYDRNDNEELIGYEVTRTITIKLREIDNYELFVQALVDAGVDRLSDVRADVDDRTALLEAALEAAADKAIRKAEAIARGLRVELGAPIEVGEDRLMPAVNLRQMMASDAQLEEIVVAGNRAGLSDPLRFVPSNIIVSGTVMARFEIVP